MNYGFCEDILKGSYFHSCLFNFYVNELGEKEKLSYKK